MADQAEFAELAMPYMSALYSAALRMTRNPSDTEDFYLYRRLGGLEAANAEQTPESEVLEAIPDATVKEALEALPEQFRMAVLLADVEGFSYKEIAEIRDVPIGTVMSRLHRGRRQLQKALWEFAGERGLHPATDRAGG